LGGITVDYHLGGVYDHPRQHRCPLSASLR